MVCYCLDLRPNSELGKFLSNKSVSIIAAIIQIILWITALSTLIFSPSELKVDSTTIAVSIVFNLLCIAFSILLLVGLIKDKMGFLLAYQIFIITFTVLALIGFFTILFTKPSQLGMKRFISTILAILLNLLFFFIIRNYYLSYKTKQQNGNPL